MITYYYSPIATWLRIPREVYQSAQDEMKPVLKQHGFTWAQKRSEWYAKGQIDPQTLQAVLGVFAPVVEMTKPSARERIERIKAPVLAETIADVINIPRTSASKPLPMYAPKLRTLADGLTKQIDAKLNSGTANQNPTPRRAGIIAGQRADAEKMQRMQRVLYALADQWESGTIEQPWSNITRKSQLETIDGRYRNPARDSLGLYEWELDEWRDWGVTRVNFDTFIAEYKAMAEGGRTAESEAQRKIRELEASIQFVKIDGFWSTQRKLAERMVELADIRPGQRVLEPSAGKGNIADAIRSLCPESIIDVAERNHTLRQILELKGYRVIGDDCIEIMPDEYRYDRALLNPPFEAGQDMAHAMHCYSLLNPGGRLVAIVGAGAIHNSTNKHKAFQAWLDEVGADIEKLDESDYGKDHGRTTGVSTYVICIDKD